MDKLTEIIGSDHLNVPKEEMVFEAAMLWLNKCPSLRQSFEKVRSWYRGFHYIHRVVVVKSGPILELLSFILSKVWKFLKLTVKPRN